MTFQHGQPRKHRSYIAVKLLIRDGMTYSIVAYTAIGTDCAESIPLLFTGRCLATAGCCDATVLALCYV
jgi:hypothetical protein